MAKASSQLSEASGASIAHVFGLGRFRASFLDSMGIFPSLVFNKMFVRPCKRGGHIGGECQLSSQLILGWNLCSPQHENCCLRLHPGLRQLTNHSSSELSPTAMINCKADTDWPRDQNKNGEFFRQGQACR